MLLCCVFVIILVLLISLLASHVSLQERVGGCAKFYAKKAVLYAKQYWVVLFPSPFVAFIACGDTPCLYHCVA